MDEIFAKLKGLINLLICIAIILGIAYFTGFLKGFTPADFQDAYGEIMNSVSGTKSTSKYKANKIPENVIRGSKSVSLMAKILNSNTKVVFYIYKDDQQANFDRELKAHLAKMPNNYSIYSYSLKRYKNLSLGSGSATSICNSFEECKANQQKASDFSATAHFLETCGKTMCVINPAKRQYVRLKKQDSTEAKAMLNYLRNWR